jgi:hypothetical protein
MFALHILVSSPCISFGKCHCFHKWGLLCFVMCFVFRMLLLCFFQQFCNFPCFFTTACESGPFDFPVLWISVYIMFVLVGRDVLCLGLYYIYCCVVCLLWCWTPFSLILLLLGMHIYWTQHWDWFTNRIEIYNNFWRICMYKGWRSMLTRS